MRDCFVLYYSTCLFIPPIKDKNKIKIIFIQKIRKLKEKFTKLKLKLKLKIEIIILGSLPIYPLSED